MDTKTIRTTLAGFLGGVAFIVGCGSGGGSTNSAMANTTQKVQDIEEMNCRISFDGVSNATGYISYAVTKYYVGELGPNASTQTFAEAYPNHIVYCATLGASSYTEYTLASLEQGNWKTYNDVAQGAYTKVWRAVLR